MYATISKYFPAIITINGNSYKYIPEIMVKYSKFFETLHSSKNPMDKSGNYVIETASGMPVKPEFIIEYFAYRHKIGTDALILHPHMLYLTSYLIDEKVEYSRHIHSLWNDEEIDDYVSMVGYGDDLWYTLYKHSQDRTNPIIINGGIFEYYPSCIKYCCDISEIPDELNIDIELPSFDIDYYFSGKDINSMSALFLALSLKAKNIDKIMDEIYSSKFTWEKLQQFYKIMNKFNIPIDEQLIRLESNLSVSIDDKKIILEIVKKLI